LPQNQIVPGAFVPLPDMANDLTNPLLYTLQVIATLAGMMAILAPLARLLLASRRERGRSIGTGHAFRRWPGVLLVTIGLVITGILLWKPLHLPLSASGQFLLAGIGFILYVPAICLYLWGLLVLGRYFGVSSVGGADLHPDHRLIQEGPYRFVRHPMYLAVLFAALGAFLVFQTWAMAVFLPLSTVVIIRASQEERLLEAEFGDEWREYVTRVPMWFPWR
jgi:protein-S-isoprenylcysteine O-methyltransferase Ste14